MIGVVGVKSIKTNTSEHNYFNGQQRSDEKRIVKLHSCSLWALPEPHMRSGSRQLVLAQARGGIPLLVGAPCEPSPPPIRFLLPRLCSEQLRREWSSSERAAAEGERQWEHGFGPPRSSRLVRQEAAPDPQIPGTAYCEKEVSYY